ncbi:uncharacterized protein BX663DRAFT_506975 [Cokeromyces recurvatus]|uniref:uncharacterized protein n=1 Tax=Cokeromyces recurvatus TaxID=90255 RepID=UPI0022201344|nr:uncharacterized protein BX663DRAFT_506975 [Cokeromyces recurvatus]KAI7903583.1 hypothetical protein BX663DRAFT_506975 [Cokeromyces recurvatus]
MAKLIDLPREIISLICCSLKQATKYTCIFLNKEFHDAAIPELWREPILSSTDTLKKFIKCLELSKCQRGECVRVMKLGYKISLTDEELINLLHLMPNLEVLELRKADTLTDKSLMLVSHYCKQLKSFGVTGALMTYRSVHYLGHCKQLRRLTFACCQYLTPFALLPFEQLMIEYLDISGCKWLNLKETAYDLGCLNYLTHLNLVCCNTVSKEFIHHLTTSRDGKPCLSNLHDFSITGGSLLDDDAIIPFIKTHTQLKGLFLLECAITDQTLQVIGSQLTFLHNLDLSFCHRLTPNGVRQLIRQCKNLRLLGLKSCGMTQHDFPEIPHYAFPSVNENNYPHINTLGYIELAYIREKNHETYGSIHTLYIYIYFYI